MLNETNSVVTSYDYMPYGNIMRSYVNTEVTYQFTGQEYDTELSLHNFRARMYDSALGMFYAVDPAGQNYSPFSYAGNNPINYIDKDGQLFIIDDILIGAAIGALISGTSYSVFAGGDWTWSGFGMSLGFGAVSGGVAGGLSGLGSALGINGHLANNMFNSMISSTTTNAIMGNEITLGSIAGMVISGGVDGLIPGFSGVSGDGGANIISELGYEMVRGALRGGLSNGVATAINGGDIGNGIISGIYAGGKQGLVQSAITIGMYGHAVAPKNDVKDKLNNMENHFSGYGVGHGAYSPVYRSGGLWSVFTNRGLAMGRNMIVPSRSEDVFLHETAHYYDMAGKGFGAFYFNGMYEQWFMKNPYLNPFTQEGWAELVRMKFGR